MVTSRGAAVSRVAERAATLELRRPRLPEVQVRLGAMLWLLRHAEAVDGIPDDDRELTERGIRQATDAGRALRAIGASIQTCLSSPKVRARQTAELACQALGIDVETDRRLSGEPVDVESLIAGRGDVLLVGHDPSFTLLVHDLTGAQARMKKGGVAAIAKGELITLLRPTELSAIASGVEER